MAKWATVYTYRSYQIQILDGATHNFGYRVNDPAFLPDYKRYATVAAAVEDIDIKTM